MKQLLLSLVVLLSAAGIATAIPNPSAVYCVEQGYEYVNGDCVFPDGSSCSAWQYYCNCEPESGFCSGGDYDCHWPCEELPCKEAGEHVLVSHCCEGLSPIPPTYIYDEDCNETGMTGWTYVCSDWGNGICETWESRCNCEEDCGVCDPEVGRDLEVGEGESYTVTCGCEEYDYCEIRGTVIVPAGTCLICNGRSWIDGNGGDGEGGYEYAHLIVYGDVWINNRFDMGRGEDAYLSVLDGGTFTQRYDSDGFKFPDDDGGVHRIFIEGWGSTLSAYCIDLIGDRDAEIHMCDGSILVLENIEESPREHHDPQDWLDDGYLIPRDTVTIEYDVPVVGGATVTTPGYPPLLCHPTKASRPYPYDGATGVKSAITEVVLEWMPSCDVAGCPMCRHFVFFGTDKQAVEDAPIYEMGWVPGGPGVPPEYKGWLPGALTEFNIGNLPLWSTFHWRIDEGPQGPIVKGDVWSFTTGCRLMAGDLNLDCLLNHEDYAILMTTWKEKQYFPWD